ncbi:MAG TPA: PDZ domain-containing protein [Pyrinomonadaceae bacterium]|nr:PDZ domain-containing protein [Pyrinomonadaceae bacterium]
MKPEMDPAVTTCANCHSPMPKELRFCRNCGFRLGEGLAEYTETVRFQNVPGAATPGNSAFAHGAGGSMTAAPAGPMKKRRRRLSGMTWIFLGLLIFFIAAAGFTAIIRPIRQNIRTSIAEQAPPRSYAGVSSFDTTDGGVTFDNVEPPGSPADKAGLVGGDIITTVDGQPVTTDDQMMELLGRTPIGKTLEIVYLRDGEQKTTQLTTVSKEEFDRLQREFRVRPIGKGLFGYEESDSERVPIPNTKMFGVRLDNVSASMPADMAGIKEGDIVIEFDGVPIRTPEELLARIRRAVPYSTITVVVLRGEERIPISLKMGKAR